MNRTTEIIRSGLVLFLAAGLGRAADRPDVLIADFESDTYGDWQETGEAFGPGPAKGALPGQMDVGGFLGERLVNSFFNGDKTRGTLTSPEFPVSRSHINFLIGGGNHPGQTCINLLVDGRVERTATGPDSEILRWHSWEVGALAGRTARLQIVDEATGGWGHISIDQIQQSDRKPEIVDDRKGAIARAMKSVQQNVARAAKDPTRPAYHLVSPANWINDPNGPIQYRGYYHLFYQFNPYGDRWGHMHWGHWRSKDLVTWEHLPIALWPSVALGEEHVFSGCATLNGRGEPMIFYTSIGAREPHCWIAQPEDDDLIRWKKFSGNPVLTQNSPDVKYYDFRDPFVFRHQGRTFMVHGGNLNAAKGGQACVSLYEAENSELTKWKYKSILFTDTNVANIECPNFFPLGGKFVLITSPHRRCDYFVGAFDAAKGRFIVESRGLADFTDSFYAPNNFVDAKGRQIMWGWIRGFKEGRGWNGCMSVPRALSLRDGQLIQQPALELEKLRGDPYRERNIKLTGDSPFLAKPRGDALEIVAEFDLRHAASVGLRVRRSTDGQRAVEINYDGVTLDVAGTRLALTHPAIEKHLKLHVFLDKSVMEVFVNDGRATVTRVIYPDTGDQGIELVAAGGAASVKSLEVWPMKSIW